jgi:DNA polymerase III delta subunit
MAKKDASPKKSAAPAVALFVGEDAYLRQEHTGTLKERLIKLHGEIQVFNFDGDEVQASDILDECRSFGLIATHKLVIVDNIAEVINAGTRALFERYVESPCESATLVLRGRTFTGGNLEKLIAQIGEVRECKAFNEKEAIDWIMKRAPHQHRAPIQLDAARALVARVGVGLLMLDTELAKLAAAAGQDAKGQPAPITPALVGEFVGVSREEAAWNVQRTILMAGPDAGLAHLRHVLDVSRQPTQLVMYAMTDMARKLHAMCAGLRQGAQPFALAKPLKLWGNSQEPFIAAAKRTTPAETLAFLQSCVEADRRSKSGLTDADRALEMQVVRFHGMK